MNQSKIAPKTANSWILLGLALISVALCFYLWVNQKFIQYPVNPLYFMLGVSVLLATRHKLAWTVASSWLVVTLSLVLMFSLKSGFEFQALHFKFAIVSYVFLLLLQLVLIGFYFKSPFLNQRSNLLGTDNRVDLALDGFMETPTNSWPVKINNISTTGLLVSTTNDVTSNIKTENLKKVVIRIPTLNNFKTDAEIKRLNQNLIGLRFSGWSLQSLAEHFKLVQHIRKNNKNPKVTQAGFSLVEMMVVVGISSFVIFMALSSLSQLDRVSMQSQLDYQYAQLKSELSWTLRDPTSWNNTKADPANTFLNCVNSKTVCNSAAAGTLQIRNSQNQLVINSANPAAGFSRNGIPCNTFDAVNGNDQCPIRFTAIPRFICTGQCLNPTVEITLQAVFRGQSSGLMINTGSGVVAVYKDPVIDNINETCLSLGGTIVNFVCKLDMLQANCPVPGEVLIGINNGNPICGSPYGVAQTCPPGNFIINFDANGNAVCALPGGI